MIKLFRYFILIVISQIASPTLLLGQTLEWRIDSVGTINSHSGYYQTMLINGSLNETDFIFEENNYLRWYAYKMYWQSTFTILPDSTYIVKLSSVNIGDTWTSWGGGEPTITIVADTITLSVPAGTFYTFVENSYLKSIPDSLLGIGFIANNIGRIKFTYLGTTSSLTSYTIIGGGGHYPLAVGNWWRMESTTGIKEQPGLSKPSEYILNQNYPNPFNPSTTISFSIPERSFVNLKVYDVLGNEVVTLVSAEREAGNHTVNFYASELPSGVYFYKMTSGNYSEIKKMMVLK